MATLTLSVKALPLPADFSLASTSSRRDRRRSLFLDDFDDQDEEMSEELSLPLSVLSPTAHRSARLALPTSDYNQDSTVHRSEWTASELTLRFPIPSFHGDEYILLTLHLGFIHYIPLKSRTAVSYVSAFAKIFAFFKSKPFPVTHLILDNESSTSLTAFLQSA